MLRTPRYLPNPILRRCIKYYLVTEFTVIES